jgi:hypothetical protein
MTFLNHLVEKRPLLPIMVEEPSIKPTGRLSDVWRVSRRYSIVASEISLLVLNYLFLLAKSDSKAPEKLAPITLTLLGLISVLFLHYPIDVIYKRGQDVSFGIKKKNPAMATMAFLSGAQQVNNIALTLSSFTAAVYGDAGDSEKQGAIYHDITKWGIASLGANFALTVAKLIITYTISKKLNSDEQSSSLTDEAKLSAWVRYCMDKDTLWDLINQLEHGKNEGEVFKVVIDNIQTQVKVTLGGKLLLIIGGDVLQALEKYYTPNSIQSALINCGVSTAYAIKIVLEKTIEYRQRARLNLNQINNLA